MRGLDLPASVKFTLLVAGATILLLLSYQLLVRYTWIGRMLNGPRTRPSGNPLLTPAPDRAR